MLLCNCFSYVLNITFHVIIYIIYFPCYNPFKLSKATSLLTSSSRNYTILVKKAVAQKSIIPSNGSDKFCDGLCYPLTFLFEKSLLKYIS